MRAACQVYRSLSIMKAEVHKSEYGVIDFLVIELHRNLQRREFNGSRAVAAMGQPPKRTIAIADTTGALASSPAGSAAPALSGVEGSRRRVTQIDVSPRVTPPVPEPPPECPATTDARPHPAS